MSKRVILKNGTAENESVVLATMIAIDGLSELGVPGELAAYELVELCKGSGTAISNCCQQKLKDFGLVGQDGRPNSSVRNIVLNAVTGEGLQITFGSPVASRPLRADGSTWGEALGDRTGRKIV